jgi:hypothetical protein
LLLVSLHLDPATISVGVKVELFEERLYVPLVTIAIACSWIRGATCVHSEPYAAFPALRKPLCHTLVTKQPANTSKLIAYKGIEWIQQ